MMMLFSVFNIITFSWRPYRLPVQTLAPSCLWMQHTNNWRTNRRQRPYIYYAIVSSSMRRMRNQLSDILTMIRWRYLCMHMPQCIVLTNNFCVLESIIIIFTQLSSSSLLPSLLHISPLFQPSSFSRSLSILCSKFIHKLKVRQTRFGQNAT